MTTKAPIFNIGKSDNISIINPFDFEKIRTLENPSNLPKNIKICPPYTKEGKEYYYYISSVVEKIIDRMTKLEFSENISFKFVLNSKICNSNNAREKILDRTLTYALE